MLHHQERKMMSFLHQPVLCLRPARAAVFLAGVSLLATAAGAQTAPAPQNRIDDIIVTAQKREQNLQEVPISITALTPATLEANRITTVGDLNAIAPNVTVRPTPGGTAAPTFTMRGLSNVATAPGVDKGISLYVDGVYLSSSQGSVFELADIERIEVLKGPQGTLFGRNSTGGAISIITRDPPGEFGARQDLTFGNYKQFRSRTRVDSPQFGPFAASVIYAHSERRGDVRNLGAGTVWDFTEATNGKWGRRRSPRHLGDQNVEAVSAAIKGDFDALTLVYKYDWTENDYTPDAQGVIHFQPNAVPGSTGQLVGGTIAFQPNPAILTPVSKKRPKAVNNAYSTESFLRNQGHNLTAQWVASDQISFRNIFSWRKVSVDSTFQLDGMGGLINVIAPPLGPIGAPLILVASNVSHRSKQWSNEIQINISTQGFDLTAGYLHFEEDVLTDGPPGARSVLQFATVPGYVIPGVGRLMSTLDIQSDAFFFQLELHPTERLDVILGSRLTLDKKSGDDNAVLGRPLKFDYKHDEPTWLIGLNYDVTDDVMVYGKFSTGYISGGQLATLTYRPEKVQSWEGGVKADLFDRRLRTNLAVFHADYDDLFIGTLGSLVGIPGAPQVIINGGKARAWGFELENTVAPVENVTLGANLGYTNFKYKEVNPVIGNINNFLPQFRPKWTANLWAQYDTPPVIGNAFVSLRADASYRSKTYGHYAPIDQAARDAITIKSVWLLNARAALTDLELGRAKAQVALWGRNLTNDKSPGFMVGLGFLYSGSYERARTYGVDVTLEF